MFDNANCVVVVGAQWGDEGKGKIVDVLSEEAHLVVRYQGGANAGHTVVVGDDEFILHQIPSGILHAAANCVIGNGVVLDPSTFVEELRELESRGITVDGRLTVSDRAHLVLPYHRLLEKLAERVQHIGTTGRGIGPAYEDKFGRRGIRVGDLLDMEAVAAQVATRVSEINTQLELAGLDDRGSVEDHLRVLEMFMTRAGPMIGDAGLIVHAAIAGGKNVLLEGAQGALLDVDHGTYPYVTSSNTTAGGAAVGAGIGPTSIGAVLGVVKAYTTRVGNGPLPTELTKGDGDRLRKLGGEFGATTGRPRRCGWFDAEVLRYAIRVNGITHLAVTKLDVLDTLDEVKLCVGYEIDGEPVESVPADGGRLLRAKPVYETHEGWREPTTEARSLEELPARARAYLNRIVKLAQVPIAYVSVGS
ncbi:MAG: adenylosuccinate synthase, partial [Gemmatimonadales bacterium]